MKKIYFTLLFLTLVCHNVFSQEINKIHYKNIDFGVNSHKITLMNEAEAMPVYTEIKYNLSGEGKVNSYIIGNMGLSYIESGSGVAQEISEMPENYYYRLGAGVEIENVNVELAYEKYQIIPGDLQEENSDDDRMTFKFRYKY